MTANLAALGANTQARRAALAHLVFNVIGVIWVLCVFYPFTNFCCHLAGYDPTATSASPQRVSMALATFHTAFNVCNTGILLWFIPQIEKIVCYLIKTKKKDEDEDFRLCFIQGGIMQTPELSVLEAQKEIRQFAVRIQRMFKMVEDIVDMKNNDESFVKLYSRIGKYESISDNMEIEIAKYLEKVSDNHLSDITKAKIRSMLREISEIESIGDSCYNIARIINRKVSEKEDFTESQYAHLHNMMKLVNEALTELCDLMGGHKEDFDANRSFNIESEINNYRNQLKTQNIYDVDNHEYTYAIGTLYMDVVNECEKLGDYIVNVVEARMGVKQK